MLELLKVWSYLHLSQHVFPLGDLAHICSFMTHNFLISNLDFSQVMMQRAAAHLPCLPIVHGCLKRNMSTNFTSQFILLVLLKHLLLHHNEVPQHSASWLGLWIWDLTSILLSFRLSVSLT